MTIQIVEDKIIWSTEIVNIDIFRPRGIYLILLLTFVKMHNLRYTPPLKL